MKEDTESLEQQAIDAAVSLDWKKAIKLNQQIIKLDKKNLNAYLRLGFVYFQINNLYMAKKYYQKALKIQTTNPIAKENLEKINVILKKKKQLKKNSHQINLDPNLFLEIPGKTKVVSLVNLGQKNILAHLKIGQKVYLKPKKRRVEIRTETKDYLGSLPDDISKRLLLFLKEKSEYSAYIKEATLNRVVVFIKEEKKGKKVAKFISFPSLSQKNINKIIDTIKKSEENEENIEENINEEIGDEEIEKLDLEKLAEELEEEKDLLLYPTSEEEEEDEEK